MTVSRLCFEGNHEWCMNCSPDGAHCSCLCHNAAWMERETQRLREQFKATPNLPQQVIKLRETIRIYGGHVPQCKGRPCTCGFQDAWRAAGLPESK